MNATHQPAETATTLNAGLSLVVIGGGGGASQVLRGARPYFARRSALIAVTDTGRSTGVARAIAEMPAPGDVRSTLANLAADPQSLWPRLLQFRIHTQAVPQLDGMAFGNLLLVALTELTGDFAQAVAITAELAGTIDPVLPISTANVNLCAELADGRVMPNELAVRSLHKPPIRRLFLTPQAAAYPPALAAIAAADIVVIGPGSFHTSVQATLLFDGVVAALQQTRATVVFVCNTTTQPGQTDGYSAFDHVRRLVEQLGPGTLDVVLLNRSPHLPDNLLQQYAAEGLHPLDPDDAEIARINALGVRPLVRDYAEITDRKRELWNKQDTIRHDPAKIGQALAEVTAGSA